MKTMLERVVFALCVVGAVAIAAERAAASPRVGEYQAHHTVSGRIRGVELVDGVVAAQLEFDVEVRNDAGAGFLHGATGHCVGVALFHPESPAGSGVCTFEDADGDVLFMRFAEDPFLSAGTAESIGGTGKYARLVVEQTHRTLVSEQIDGARFEAQGVRTGTWRVRDRSPGSGRPER